MLSISLVLLSVTLLKVGGTQEQCAPEGCSKTPPISWDPAADKYFRDYFMTEYKADKIAKQWIKYSNMDPVDRLTNQGNISHHISRRSPALFDYDRCCQSKLAFRWDWRMRNSQGYMRNVVHMTWTVPHRYQWYLQGTCANSNGSCTGICRQRKTLQSMLVYVDGWSRVTFDWFSVNGYCSCQSN